MASAISSLAPTGATMPPGPMASSPSKGPSRISRQAPTSVATQGTPAAPASRMTSGSASLMLVSTRTSMRPR
ncbi:hypothetical protein D3C73_1644050 [compost metagenome]